MRSGRRHPDVATARRIIRNQTGRCAYCNASLVERGIEWDHFVPFAFSGVNLSDNWTAACPQCNRAKGAKHLATDEAIYNFCYDMTVRHGELSEGWPDGYLETWPWLK